MQPKFAIRRVRSPKSGKLARPRLQRFQAGEVVSVSIKDSRRRRAKIVRQTRSGAIAIGIDPFLKGLGRKGEPKMRKRQRMVLVSRRQLGKP
jgi:hypothetical protein